MSTITLSKEHGYVLLGAIESAAVVTWMARNVSVARKKYNVKYPLVYAENDNETGRLFNCIQRAHQNTLEYTPSYYFFLATCGLRYPKYAASCSVLWCIGRVLFAKGYYTGKPENRRWGAIGMLGSLGLIGGTAYWAYELLKN